MKEFLPTLKQICYGLKAGWYSLEGDSVGLEVNYSILDGVTGNLCDDLLWLGDDL